MPYHPTSRRPLAHRSHAAAGLRRIVLAALVTGLSTLLLTAHPVSAASSGQASTVAPSAGSWPLTPRPELVSRFDPPSSPWGPGHRGVDLLGAPGQPVRAAAGGTVAYSGLLAGKGVVVVRHGSTRTTYEPVDGVVTVGATVVSGDLLGHLHPGGSHCPPRACLHWGLIEDTVEGDVYRDPLTLVGGGPVRLLPWAGLGSPVPHPVLFSPQAAPEAPAQSVQARGWAWR